MTKHYNYPGSELELFQQAKNWKKYFAGKIKTYIKGNVLEVGAGIGETTFFLLNENVETWFCLEPDEKLFTALKNKFHSIKIKIVQGRIDDLPEALQFDTILYVDVLEHIEDDKKEIIKAVSKLKNNGNLIVLSPAFQFLYNPFDNSIGHYRRYSKKTLRSVIPHQNLSEIKLFYLETSGFFLLFLNKFFSKKNYPSKITILVWDRIFIPLSKIIDKILFHSIGKTIIGIWKHE